MGDAATRAPESEALSLRAEAQRVAALAMSAARSGLFWLESVPLRGTRALGGLREDATPPEEMVEDARRALWSLLERDAERIAEGIYPLSVLAPEAPQRHALGYLRLLHDSVGAARRASRGVAKDFDEKAEAFLDGLPSYYRRNFHYQTNGYLSDTSATLYEHQVQILFRGAADAMRRLLIAPMRRGLDSETGRGLRLLELGAGCGSATRFVAAALPDAHIVAVDLSAPYLGMAKRRHAHLSRVDWLQGDAGDLDFGDDRFDAVYSVFLFHELPAVARREVVRESLRVVKPAGWIGMVDSVQHHDVEALRWALHQFPLSFHEPFFRDYEQSPMEALFRDAGLVDLHYERGFTAKCVGGRAPR